MNNQKGFSLIEIMIVVAIIGILTAVAIPAYMAYIQRARFASLVMPNIKAMHTAIATIYSSSNQFPSDLELVTPVADTTYFTPTLVDSFGNLKIVIHGGPTGKLSRMEGQVLWTGPMTGQGGRITDWSMTGTLATSLGIANY